MVPKLKHIETHIPAAKRRSRKTVAEILLHLFKNRTTPVLIAVGGPGGTGKSTFCEFLCRELPGADVLILDNYKTTRSQRSSRNLYGPHPDANRIELIVTHLQLLRNGDTIEVPLYDRKRGEANSTIPFSPHRFVLLDGEVSTYHHFRQYIDFSIFIDADWKTQLSTRISRDIQLRGYSQEKAIATFLHSNLREFARYGAESKTWADMHLYCHDDYSLEIEALSDNVFNQCQSLLCNTHSVIGLNGCLCDIPVPFTHNNTVDEKSLVLHLEFLYQKGIRRVLVNGSNGENHSLTHDERKQVLRIARYSFPGFIALGCYDEGLKGTLQQIGWAERYGADAVVLFVPAWFDMVSEDGVRHYIDRLTEATGLPSLIQCSRRLPDQLVRAVVQSAHHSGMICFSEYPECMFGHGRYFYAIDSFVPQRLSDCDCGIISGISSVFPSPYLGIENAVMNVDNSRFKMVQSSITALNGIFGGPAFTAKVKYLLSCILKGYCASVRLPLLALSSQEACSLDILLENRAESGY